MSNQTLQRTPQKARPATSGRSGQYRRQTARLEGRRDGKPLVFGWGKHLSRAQKGRIQMLALYGFGGLVILAVLAVFGFGIVQQNVLIPNQTIVTVGGTSFSQDAYRKQLAYRAAVIYNAVTKDNRDVQDLQTKATNGDKDAQAKLNVVASQMQADEADYQQTSITVTAINDLIEDQLLRSYIAGAVQRDASTKDQLTVTSGDVDKALTNFKGSFQAEAKYNDFLTQNGLSAGDVRAALERDLRRDQVQVYLAKQITTPSRQARVRRIMTNDRAAAEKAQADIAAKKATWEDLAKQVSLDPNTKNTGGDLGWISTGLGDAAIEQWALDPARKVNDEIVLKDTTGTYDFVQITDIAAQREVSQGNLSAARGNALPHFLQGRKADPAARVGTPDADMLSADRNLPKTPSLTATLPTPPHISAGQLPGGPQGVGQNSQP